MTLEPLTVVLPELVSTAGRLRGARRRSHGARRQHSPRRRSPPRRPSRPTRSYRSYPGSSRFRAHPAGTSISIRGIGDSRVLVLMDGEPVGGSLLQNIDLSRLSTVAVSRIEVTKGPASAIYGSDRPRRGHQPGHPGPAAIAPARTVGTHGSFGQARGATATPVAPSASSASASPVARESRKWCRASRSDRTRSSASTTCAAASASRELARGTPRRRDLLLRAPALAPGGAGSTASMTTRASPAGSRVRSRRRAGSGVRGSTPSISSTSTARRRATCRSPTPGHPLRRKTFFAV